jgi:Uma2 family endonuclease
MGLALSKSGESFTYKDYLTWTNPAERWELIDGLAYDMSPAPGTFHQSISGELFTIIKIFLRGKPCNVFAAPFDVRLPDGDESDDDTMTVVQPDIIVVCDKSKIDKRGVRGVPDFVAEILSPSTATKDYREKYDLYEKHGVKEYWIIDPGRMVSTYRIGSDGKFQPGIIVELGGVVESSVLKGLKISVTDLFPEI